MNQSMIIYSVLQASWYNVAQLWYNFIILPQKVYCTTNRHLAIVIYLLILSES